MRSYLNFLSEFSGSMKLDRVIREIEQEFQYVEREERVREREKEKAR